MNETDIPERLIGHRQLPDASSAVSAYEAVAKLHGFILPDEFPLQLGPAGRKPGFGDSSLLGSFGLQTRDDRFSPIQAIDVIVRETKEGRYPLAYLFSNSTDWERSWHVGLFARHRSSLLLINLAEGKVEVSGRAAIRKRLIRTILATPGRKGIHIMTYRLPAAV
jgi:hypothetical protein